MFKEVGTTPVCERQPYSFQKTLEGIHLGRLALLSLCLNGYVPFLWLPIMGRLGASHTHLREPAAFPGDCCLVNGKG